jgi:thioredoxin-related protein
MRIMLAMAILFLPLHNSAQLVQNDDGIKWQNGLNWQQVKELAKKQNRYIFLDCYTTWCGPCKKMDNEVYINDTVGAYFNDKFISVKLQMNQTKSDEQWIKNLYQDADFIGKQYKITVFPTFLFFSPEGKLVHKETGFKQVPKLIAEAQKATKPGKTYVDMYDEYDRLVEQYKEGKRDYSRFPYMIEAAQMLRDLAFSQILIKEYYVYLSTLKNRQLYTQDKIGFIAKNINSTKDKFFEIFYSNGRKVDAIMKKKGFAQATVELVIRKEQIGPVVQKFFKTNSLKQIREGAEPEWNTLFQSICTSFNRILAERTIRAEKVIFYRAVQNMPAYIALFVLQYDNGELDTTDKQTDIALNDLAWNIFLKSKDKDQLNKGIKIIEGVLRRKNAFKEYSCAPLDTYASLLYKASILHNANLINEAISWENKALENAIENQFQIDNFRSKIDKMKKGEPTWPL